jgi:hypothetical protein
MRIIFENSESAAPVAPLSSEAKEKLVELTEDWFKTAPNFEDDEEE